MALANQEALRLGHAYIGTEHILLGLVRESTGVGANVLKNLNVKLPRVRLELEKLLKNGSGEGTEEKLPQTRLAKKVIEYAIEESERLNHSYVGTEHLLLGLLQVQDGVAAQVLINLGLKLDSVREEVLDLLGAGNERPCAVPEAPDVDSTADGEALGEFYAHDPLAAMLRAALAELQIRKDDAVRNQEYEVAASYRDLQVNVEGLMDKLASILARKPSPDTDS